jgi:hypothetical protein
MTMIIRQKRVWRLLREKHRRRKSLGPNRAKIWRRDNQLIRLNVFKKTGQTLLPEACAELATTAGW